MNKRVITVSRQFGSGGRTIGRLVADRLGIAYYDRELVEKIEKETGLAADYILDAGEYACAKSNFLFNMAFSHDTAVLPMQDQLYLTQCKLIRELADREPCVIVGRCADFVLQGRGDCLHTFFYADPAFRAKRIVQLYGESADEPEKRLKDKDGKRGVYYRHYTGRPWGAVQNYHLCLDTGVIGIETCAELVVRAAGG